MGRQFSIRSLILATTSAGICLALTRNFVLSAYLLCILAMTYGLCITDAVLMKDNALPRPVASSLICSWSTASLMFMLLLYIFRPPGAGGPRQYVGDHLVGSWIFATRSSVFLLMFILPPACVLLAAIRTFTSKSTTLRFGWFFAAAASFVTASVIIWSNTWFFPDV